MKFLSARDKRSIAARAKAAPLRIDLGDEVNVVVVENFYGYLDSADTLNDGNAHYDLGAGGRGVTTDCHDGTNTVFTDYSSAGPTTWGGCHIMGVSAGMDYRF